MAEQISNLGKELNNTFLPSSLLRKSHNKLNASLTQKYEFQKTTGNAFITIDPPEIKYAGYQLDKSYTSTVRIINRAPIPQRIAIIPPESQSFAIRTNKKGSIAAGMSETITVLFRSNEYKYIKFKNRYQTDVISIRTETENFVIPLYAYPTLPDLRAIFPKMIDFGAVQCKEPATYYYPIMNSVPLNFQFEFIYQKESQEISINPLKGVIPANQTLTVQITFVPLAKSTSSAEVYLQIQQFDFQPLPIKIIGSGMQKNVLNQSKRIKSSRLAPLKDGEQSKKTPQPLLKRRESGSMSATQQQFAATGTINPNPSGTVTMKKTLIRKLVSTKKVEQESKPLNPAKIAQRQYLNRFTRVQQLDKEKQIKFSQYLGDRAMTQEEIQNEKQIVEEIEKIRMKAMEKICVQRYNPEHSSDVDVELKIVPQKTVTWDDKQNDEHLNRRKALTRFMNAGTKVILKYRLLKRLQKIKDLIGDRTTRQEVKKLVDESHAKALDQQQGISLSDEFDLDFRMNSIQPSYFEVQFEDSNQKQIKVQLKPEGKTSFDDLTELKQVEAHRVDKFNLTPMQYPADHFYHSSKIPEGRQSGQEELYYKTSALDSYNPDSLTSVYSLPIKVPAHHFIYDDQKIKIYQNYNCYDEKDPEIILEESGPIQDQFEGWTGGQFQILKYKFSRNVGCPYTTFSGFNFSTERNPLPPEATLGQGLPRFIEEPSHEDTIEMGDSDEQNLDQIPVEPAHKFVETIEGNNADLKERRAKKQIRNPEREVREQIERNIDNLRLKGIGDYVGRIMQSNKWVDRSQNRLLL